MNMRNLKYFSFGIISLIFASCIEEKTYLFRMRKNWKMQNLVYLQIFSKNREEHIYYCY